MHEVFVSWHLFFTLVWALLERSESNRKTHEDALQSTQTERRFSRVISSDLDRLSGTDGAIESVKPFVKKSARRGIDADDLTVELWPPSMMMVVDMNHCALANDLLVELWPPSMMGCV